MPRGVRLTNNFQAILTRSLRRGGDPFLPMSYTGQAVAMHGFETVLRKEVNKHVTCPGRWRIRDRVRNDPAAAVDQEQAAPLPNLGGFEIPGW